MREGLYGLSILDADDVDLPETSIDGRTYVEAKPGREYKVDIAIYKGINGQFPVKSCMVYLFIDGKACDKELLQLSTDSWGIKFNGYEMDCDHFRAFEFMTAPTATDYTDTAESATG